MVRAWLYCIVLAGLLALLLLGATSWIIYSPTGTRWALTELVDSSGSVLKIGQIKGTLGGALQIRDLALNQQGLQLQIADLSMHNRLRGLFPISLDIESLRLIDLQIQSVPSSEQKTPQRIHWPQLPWVLGLLQVNLPDLSVEQVHWQQQGKLPLVIDRLQGDLNWGNGTLKSSRLKLQLPGIQTSGSFSLGLEQPELKFSVAVDSRNPDTFWRQLQLHADLQSEIRGEILHGGVQLEIATEKGSVLAATAELGLTEDQLLFQHMQLRRPHRPGQITASGSLRFSGAEPELLGQLQLDQLDLQAETGQPVKLSGTLQLKGGVESYSGRFNLRNQGTVLSKASVSGQFSGDTHQLTLLELQGAWLAGAVSGTAHLNWGGGWNLQAQLTGQGFDPQLLSPRLAGQLNGDLQANIALSDAGQKSGWAKLQLHDSQLQNHPLSGEVALQIRDDVWLIDQFQLRGEGMLLQASGNPAESLAVSWRIENLGDLLTEASGRLSGAGWLRWRQQILTSEFSAEGTQLAIGRWRLAQLQLSGKTENAQSSWQLWMQAKGVNSGQPFLVFDLAEVRWSGSLDRHQLNLKLARQLDRLSVDFAGGWADQQWTGAVKHLQLAGPDIGDWHLAQSTNLRLSRELVMIEPLRLDNKSTGEISLHGRFQPTDKQIEADLSWGKLDLALLRPWLSDWNISGKSDGTLQLHQGVQNSLHGEVDFSGMLAHQELQWQISSSKLLIDWEQALKSRVQLELADGGRVSAVLNSAQAPAFSWPEQAEIQLTGEKFPLALLHPWLPQGLNINSLVDWKCVGSWRVDEPLKLTGTAHAGAGRFYWQEDEGILGADISAIDLSWQWHQRLQGNLSIMLHEQGNIDSTFALPLAARFPLAFEPTASMAVELNARLQELGLLSIIFPGRLQESRGRLKLDLQLAGTLRKPQLQGNFYLYDAAAFIPAAGVQLEGMELQGTFAGNRLRVSQLQLQSGAGQLSGSGQLKMENWRPGLYQLQLKGKDFQLINLPDLQVRANPDLQVEGNLEKIKVRGKVEFPYVLVSGKQKSTLASNSPDLQVVDRQASPLPTAKLRHDIDLQLLLGDRVLLNTSGIDARLEGSLRLQSNDQQDLAANGEIRVAKGIYSSYGVSLDITRGNLYFAGGPLEQPALDILALRTTGEVKAGVKVTGTPQVPIVKLYSEPTMADTDILSYIVLGHPVGADSSQSGLLLTAAGALLSQGESVSLQEKLKGRLGLDVLDVSAGNGDVNSSIITTGKYLSPDLYVGLGYSLFSNTNEVKVRYSLTPAWEIESSIGVESGVDMFYRIEIK